MKIFVDTADLKEITTALSWGVVGGVTTNPSLIKKAAEKLQQDLKQYICEILRVAGREHPVSLEVLGGSAQEMIDQGRRLFELFNRVAKNVVIKIPINPALDANDKLTYDGIKAIRTLAEGGIPINTTLIMTPEQALLAAKAGAAYVSPFAGRIDDYLRDSEKLKYDKAEYFPQEGLVLRDGEKLMDNGILSGVDLVVQIVQIFRKYDLKTEVLAASLRNARHVREVALAGAHIATIPFDVLAQMTSHPKTFEGMKKFVADIVPEYGALFA